MEYLTTRRILILVVIIAIASAGILASFYRPPPPQPPPPKPAIGILSIYGYLLSDTEKNLYLKAITYAIKNETIKGVLVRIDSPGGYATIAEDVYYGLRELDSKKPVVALVEGLAASGGFFVAVGARYIIAEPTAFVGNIGVIATAPPLIVPSESALDTGPYKYSGFSIREFPFLVRDALNTFLAAVNESRGTKLNVSLDELSLGKLYLGSEALRLGLIDEVGSYPFALAKVAQLAGVEEYYVVDLLSAVGNRSIGLVGRELWNNGTKLSIKLLRAHSRSPLTLYYLSPYYLKDFPKGLFDYQYTFPEGMPFEQMYAMELPPLTNTVLIDIAHGNMFNPTIFGELLGHIVKKGGHIMLVRQGVNLTGLLSRRPSALLVFTPTMPYSDQEKLVIRNFVQEGGRLVLVYDTSMAYAENINSLAEEFGMYFSDGYLYDIKDNYGIYRNIVIRNFADHPLMRGLTELALFTATHIYTNATPLALTDYEAVLSMTEEKGEYVPIAINGNVLAIADSTFLMDPFCKIADNGKFLEKVTEFLLGASAH